MTLTSRNPATGAAVAAYPEMSQKEVFGVLSQVHDAFMAWRQQSFGQRAQRMQRAAALLRRDADRFARLMAEEMGKPLAQGRGEIDKCAWACDFYTEHAERFLASEPVATEARESYVAFEPLGVILAVMPWNFPFWQVFRFAAPAMMAGNAVVLKHASNVPRCAQAIERLIQDAGFPEHLVRAVMIGSARVAGVIASPFVAAVTVTGSTPAGRAVAQAAGRALKKAVLELGGSDPYIVLEDADLEEAVGTCVAARLVNAGQSCIAAKRLIVVEQVRIRCEQLLRDRMREQKMGDPLEEGVTIGPLARHDLRDELDRQVQRSVAEGARLLLGGQVPDLPGAYYPPTILTDVRKGMPAYEEELFGPVAVVIPVKDEAEAIRVANDSPFGLGAAVFTRDRARGEQIARRLEVGCCFVNAQVRSDPRLPFGGVKQSGYGRELGIFGIREFVNIKTVYIT